MRREVNTEHTDKPFRDKILKQEHGPVRTGENMPPPFDWSAMPEPRLKISVARMVWSSLLVLTIIIVATLVFMPEATQKPDTPIHDTENVPAPETKPSMTTDKLQFMADNTHTDENAEKEGNVNSTDAAFSVTGASSSDNTGAGELRKNRNETLSEKAMKEEETADGKLISDNGSNRESNGSVKTSSASANERSGKDVEERNQTTVTNVQTKNESDMSSRSAEAGHQVENDADETNQSGESSGRSTAESDSGQRGMGVEVVPLIAGAGMTSSIESIDELARPTPEVTVPATRFIARNRFELRVFGSVNQGYRVLSGNGSNEDVVDRINMNESATVNLGIGAHFGWNINRRWTLLTGISKRTTTINYRFSKRVIYDKAREIINSSGDFENSEEFVFETSGGHSTARTKYAWRLLQDGLKHGDHLDFTFEFEREYHSVVIPLQVQYNVVNNAFKFGVIAGAQYARIYKTELHLNRPEAKIRPDQHPMPPAGRDFFTKNTFDVLLPDRGLNKNIYEASIGLHFGYQFTELLGVYLQPSYSHGLNNIYASDNFSSVPTNKQIDAGIILTF